MVEYRNSRQAQQGYRSPPMSEFRKTCQKCQYQPWCQRGAFFLDNNNLNLASSDSSLIPDTFLSPRGPSWFKVQTFTGLPSRASRVLDSPSPLSLSRAEKADLECRAPVAVAVLFVLFPWLTARNPVLVVARGRREIIIIEVANK